MPEGGGGRILSRKQEALSELIRVAGALVRCSMLPDTSLPEYKPPGKRVIADARHKCLNYGIRIRDAVAKLQEQGGE